ncbi:hypothetical protein N7532_008346 [Penicillium argentinense]|uniref:Uncharacterized protein n=1 Tax=Penicillium argentinense TaxID=1131581 RepID=A0A9W9EXA7_9EURO|nr:uncharacterized protein N7532_008346 [Penicillium argentinense]KAJ5089662.1 hypothetical protein N7532_008346 [Penicillium argentinense]
MPHLRNHRRHHSWPHCGSDPCMRESCRAELPIPQPGAGQPGPFVTPWSSQQAAVVPLITEEFSNDDAEMAGIERTQIPRAHRLWSRPLRDRREDTPIPAAAPEARKQVHRSVLQRLIRRPPLDKTRSLFVMPTTKTAGDQLVISGWMLPRNSARPVIMTDRVRTALSAAEEARLVAERRHRRCHSEQPRAWRRPSATLWTLQEEGGTDETGSSVPRSLSET